MTTLERSLHKYDLAHLRIIAKFWGIALQAGERKAAREELSEKLLNSSLATEVIEALLPEARHALETLIKNQGRMPWAAFTREFGALREIGAGKRDREKSYLHPISAAETLFYRALLARTFFDTPSGAIEFAYIPDDLFGIIHPKDDVPITSAQILGRLARPDERAYTILANDFILDDLTTLLAALRLGWDEPPLPLNTSKRFARDLLLAARLITDAGLKPDRVKAHLEQNRAEAFAGLQEIWRKSPIFNELDQVPSIICEGEWRNTPLDTRNAIFGFLDGIPRGKWWSLKALIADIKKEHPDFQRKAGDYEAWFIRSVEASKKLNDTSIKKPFESQSLRGFEHWDDVEGALIRYFIEGVLFWLGFIDLASAKKNGAITAFRIKSNGLPTPEKGKINLSSSGQITISRFAPRVARYQISRFCEWEKSKISDEYKYQLTPSSLERAREQGLKVSHLLGLLKKYADVEIPPTLGKALRRWAVNGTEARVKTLSILRLNKPEDLRVLRQSKAGRFLGEVLGPTAVVVKAEASPKITAALIEMGILMQDEK